MNNQTAQQLIKLTQNSYQLIAEEFSNSRLLNWLEIEGVIKKYVKDGDKILDLGCGNGRLLKSLTKSDLKNISYLGLDGCDSLIQKAQQIPPPAEQINNWRIKFICDDILNLTQFKDNEFEAIFMIASFCHIPSKKLRQKTMANLRRILKPQGVLIMTNWNLWNLKNKKSVWQSILPKHNVKTTMYLKGLDIKDVVTWWQNKYPLYYYAFTKKELSKLFKKFNLEVLENIYVKQGQKAYWWNGFNILTIARKK